jgi:zinc protease
MLLRLVSSLSLAGAVACSTQRDLPPPIQPLTPTPDAAFRWRTAGARPTARPALDAHWSKLENGFTVVHVQRDDLPIVALQYTNRAAGSAGSAHSGELIALTGDALTNGGTQLPGGKILSRVSVNGVAPFVGTTTGVTSLSFQVLRPMFARSVEVLARTVRFPAFEPNGIEVARGMTLELIRDRYQDASSLMEESALGELIGRTAARDLSASNARTVAELRRDQIVRCYADLYRPESSALIVVGPVARAEALEHATRWFGNWQAQDAPPRAPKQFRFATPLPGVRIHVIDSGPRSQAHLLLTKRGAPLLSEYYVPLSLVSAVLGAIGDSRLHQSLRHEQGKTYGVRAEQSADGNLSLFSIEGLFDTDQLSDVIAQLLSQLGRLTREPISPAELEIARVRAKAEILERLSTNAGTADLLAWLFGLEAPDGLERLEHALERATSAQLLEAAQRYLDPSSVDIFVFGHAEALVPDLDRLGSVSLYQVR